MIKFDFNFDPKKFRNQVEKATEKSATEHYRNKLRGVVCPVHGTSPTVTPNGSIATKMSWNINACCDDQLKIVHQKLGVTQSDDFGGNYTGGIGE